MSGKGEVCAGQVYRHYKGDYYRILHLASHTEDMERVVVYRKLFNPDYNPPIWVRPLALFMSRVFVDGKLVDRFSLTQNIPEQQERPWLNLCLSVECDRVKFSGEIMSVDTNQSQVVHFPKNRNVFQFDEEVSRIFPDMARRSIPMYEEAHRLHISLYANQIATSPRTVFYDIGASRGHFFKALCNQFQILPNVGTPVFECVAVDNSMHMLNALKEEMPWIRTVEADAAYLPDFQEPADFISMFYILQFLETPNEKLAALRWAFRNLKPGGVLFLGQKGLVSSTYDSIFTDEYYRFRMENGYTMDEIQAKTKALKNSMWPLSDEWLEELCYQAGFIDYTETTRWLMFTTSMCTKQGDCNE